MWKLKRSVNVQKTNNVQKQREQEPLPHHHEFYIQVYALVICALTMFLRHNVSTVHIVLFLSLDALTILQAICVT